MPRTPEQEAPHRIDAQLAECGWIVQDSRKADFSAGDHIVMSLSIEPDDFDYAPVSHRGGLSKAHQLFGDDLPRLLDELNEALAA